MRCESLPLWLLGRAKRETRCTIFIDDEDCESGTAFRDGRRIAEAVGEGSQLGRMFGDWRRVIP